MPVVKGSKQERMVVVPYQPWRTFVIGTSVLLLLLATGFGSYYFGLNQGARKSGNASAERDQLLLDVADYRQQLEALGQELVNSQQASVVDRQALESVQETILSLRGKIVQLEEDVVFYKQILSPENDETGLVIGQLDLFVTGTENRFRYRLELKQLGNNDVPIEGHVNVNILGVQEHEDVSMPLRSLAVSNMPLDIKLQFRYFQNIEGELVIPDNFVPEKVQIIAVAEGRNAKTVQKSFGWLVEG
ncbi:MAG: hypothetical protein RQ899_09545 [Pseudomonadales bacterium]|nr:hypothetical protein [Pseudomonadales bacterium]